MELFLHISSGPDDSRRVGPYQSHDLIVGRGAGTHVRLGDPAASRQHCRIEVTDEGVLLVDLESRWGTRVNGDRVERRRLVDGDEILVGDTMLRVELSESAERTTLPPRSQPYELDGQPDGDDPFPSARDEPSREPRPTDTARPGTARPRVSHGPDQSRRDDVGPIPPPMELRELVGHTLVRYKIRDVIAEARTGTLFRARDVRHDRPVALKVLWPELTGDETEVARFVRAFQTMMGLRHPNLVRLYGAGKTGSYCWTACEFVDGESLSRTARKRGVAGMLDWRSTLRIALDVARALEAAREHGVVHRNVTPTNILVTRDNRAKLGDVALAKAVAGSMVQKVTRSGDVVGEIALSAPEQLQGLPEDTRTDLYNLGATLFFALTGRTPFERSTVAGTAAAIQKAQVEPPSRFQLSIPGQFDQVVVRMLARRREDRPDTPDDLVRELERIARFNNIDTSPLP